MRKNKTENFKGSKMKGKNKGGWKKREKSDRQNSSGLQDDMKDILADPRFAHVATDLRLRSMPQEEHKVLLDDRFKSLLTDEKFYEKNTMDPRGRKGSYSTKENLLRFYRLPSDIEDSDAKESSGEDEEDSGEDTEEELKDKDSRIKTKEKDATLEEDERTAKEMAAIPRDLRERLQDLTQDYARGELFFSDDSSDDDSSSSDEEEIEEFKWGELDHDAEWDTEGNEVEETSRLALCNMDWDRVKAADIMKLFSSFCPRGGCIKKVTIYPSEFGKQRMAEESMHGPHELVSAPSKEEEETHDVDPSKLEKGVVYDEKADMVQYEKLRKYQRNRLMYYYAVIECDSVATARIIYTECDRQPFEESGVLIDLRYIPSDMTFDEEVFDACDTVPDSYIGKHFTTSALQLAQPSLTWDEADPERERILSVTMAKALKGEEINEEAVRNFIASGSDTEDSDSVQEDSENEDDDIKQSRIAKFRELIKDIDEKEKKKKVFRDDLESMFNIDDDLDDDEEDDGDDDEEDDEEEEDEDDEENEYDNEEDSDMDRIERSHFRPSKNQSGIPSKERTQRIMDKNINMKEEEEDEEQEEPVLNKIDRSCFNPSENRLEMRSKKMKKRKQKKRDEDDISNDFGNKELPEGSELKSDSDFAERKNNINSKKNNKIQKTRKEKHKMNTVEEEKNNDLELMLMDEREKEKKHFNMRKIIEENKNRKRKSNANMKQTKIKEKQLDKQAKENEDEFKINTTDSRFNQLFTSAEYNIDPSHSQFKRTKAMDCLISDIQNRRVTTEIETLHNAKRPRTEELGKKDQELSLLVKKVKVKTNRQVWK